MRDRHQRQRDTARHRQIDTRLLDDQHLAEPGNGETAATGSIPAIEVAETLAESISALTTNNSTVATPTVTSPLDAAVRDAARKTLRRSVSPDTG
ncbi:hypothetical protein [Mycobacterium sp. URHB0021]